MYKIFSFLKLIAVKQIKKSPKRPVTRVVISGEAFEKKLFSSDLENALTIAELNDVLKNYGLNLEIKITDGQVMYPELNKLPGENENYTKDLHKKLLIDLRLIIPDTLPYSNDQELDLGVNDKTRVGFRSLTRILEMLKVVSEVASGSVNTHEGRVNQLCPTKDAMKELLQGYIDTKEEDLSKFFAAKIGGIEIGKKEAVTLSDVGKESLQESFQGFLDENENPTDLRDYEKKVHRFMQVFAFFKSKETDFVGRIQETQKWNNGDNSFVILEKNFDRELEKVTEVDIPGRIKVVEDYSQKFLKPYAMSLEYGILDKNVVTKAYIPLMKGIRKKIKDNEEIILDSLLTQLIQNEINSVDDKESIESVQQFLDELKKTQITYSKKFQIKICEKITTNIELVEKAMTRYLAINQEVSFGSASGNIVEKISEIVCKVLEALDVQIDIKKISEISKTNELLILGTKTDQKDSDIVFKIQSDARLIQEITSKLLSEQAESSPNTPTKLENPLAARTPIKRSITSSSSLSSSNSPGSEVDLTSISGSDHESDVDDPLIEVLPKIKDLARKVLVWEKNIEHKGKYAEQKNRSKEIKDAFVTALTWEPISDVEVYVTIMSDPIVQQAVEVLESEDKTALKQGIADHVIAKKKEGISGRFNELSKAINSIPSNNDTTSLENLFKITERRDTKPDDFLSNYFNEAKKTRTAKGSKEKKKVGSISKSIFESIEKLFTEFGITQTGFFKECVETPSRSKQLSKFASITVEGGNPKKGSPGNSVVPVSNSDGRVRLAELVTAFKGKFENFCKNNITCMPIAKGIGWREVFENSYSYQIDSEKTLATVSFPKIFSKQTKKEKLTQLNTYKEAIKKHIRKLCIDTTGYLSPDSIIKAIQQNTDITTNKVNIEAIWGLNLYNDESKAVLLHLVHHYVAFDYVCSAIKNDRNDILERFKLYGVVDFTDIEVSQRIQVLAQAIKLAKDSVAPLLFTSKQAEGIGVIAKAHKSEIENWVGEPGVGKTSLIRALLQLFPGRWQKVILVTPIPEPSLGRYLDGNNTQGYMTPADLMGLENFDDFQDAIIILDECDDLSYKDFFEKIEANPDFSKNVTMVSMTGTKNWGLTLSEIVALTVEANQLQSLTDAESIKNKEFVEKKRMETLIGFGTVLNQFVKVFMNEKLSVEEKGDRCPINVLNEQLGRLMQKKENGKSIVLQNYDVELKHNNEGVISSSLGSILISELFQKIQEYLNPQESIIVTFLDPETGKQCWYTVEKNTHSQKSFNQPRDISALPTLAVLTNNQYRGVDLGTAVNGTNVSCTECAISLELTLETFLQMLGRIRLMQPGTPVHLVLPGIVSVVDLKIKLLDASIRDFEQKNPEKIKKLAMQTFQGKLQRGFWEWLSGIEHAYANVLGETTVKAVMRSFKTQEFENQVRDSIRVAYNNKKRSAQSLQESLNFFITDTDVRQALSSQFWVDIYQEVFANIVRPKFKQSLECMVSSSPQKAQPNNTKDTFHRDAFIALMNRLGIENAAVSEIKKSFVDQLIVLVNEHYPESEKKSNRLQVRTKIINILTNQMQAVGGKDWETEREIELRDTLDDNGLDRRYGITVSAGKAGKKIYRRSEETSNKLNMEYRQDLQDWLLKLIKDPSRVDYFMRQRRLPKHEREFISKSKSKYSFMRFDEDYKLNNQRELLLDKIISFEAVGVDKGLANQMIQKALAEDNFLESVEGTNHINSQSFASHVSAFREMDDSIAPLYINTEGGALTIVRYLLEQLKNQGTLLNLSNKIKEFLFENLPRILSGSNQNDNIVTRYSPARRKSTVVTRQLSSAITTEEGERKTQLEQERILTELKRYFENPS